MPKKWCIAMELPGRTEMSKREEALKESSNRRKTETKEKALNTIRRMRATEAEITFSSVAKESGVSRGYLYKTEEIRLEIEKSRSQVYEIRKKKQERYQRTAKSRDAVIEAKDRRIKKLEEEIRQLKKELVVLRGQLYDNS